MEYLAEAERVLEYAAGCGRTIERGLIVVTLHNQATVYQRIWELVRSADYIEAIIYNVRAFLEGEEGAGEKWKEGREGKSNGGRDEKSLEEESRLALHLGTKLSLITYLLQFCAVSSQIKNHSTALTSARSALSLLKQYCQQLHLYEKSLPQSSTTAQISPFERTLLNDLQTIGDFTDDNPSQAQIQNLTSKAYKSIIGFQKRLQRQPLGLSKPQIKQLQLFSLGQLMQISPLSLSKIQQRVELQVQLTLVNKIYKAIYISITHFTIATELRLLANQRYGMETPAKRGSAEFRQSQVHHLVAVITIALYVPCYTKYFEHILKSYNNHYQVDLTQVQSVSVSEEGDVVRLEIQSVSEENQETGARGREKEKEREENGGLKKLKELQEWKQKAMKQGANLDAFKRNDRTDREKPHNKTAQQLGLPELDFNSPSSSENSKLKQLNRTGTDPHNHTQHTHTERSTSKKSKMTHRKGKSKKKGEQRTEREKRIIIVEKVTSKSHSKHRKSGHKRSRSRGEGENEHEHEEKVVHYFQYDNYSKKVVRKGKDKQKEREREREREKGQKESDLLKRVKNPRQKKPQNMLNTHMKKMKHISSTKDMAPFDLKTVKHMKSTEHLRPAQSRKHK